MLRCLLVVGLLLQFFAVIAVAGEWSLVKNSGDIRVYSRKVADSAINEVRAVTAVSAEIASVVRLLRDHEARVRWDAFSGETYVYKTISPTEELVYMHSDLPWPVSDRDMLVHVQWTRDPETGVVNMESKATDGIVQPKDDRVRVTHAWQHWRLTPAGEGRVEINTDIFLDPAGPLPAWLLNLLSVDAPYNALDKMRKVLDEGGFSQSGAEFVREAK